MLAGAFLALYKYKTIQTNAIMAQPPPLEWKDADSIPLDLQLDLDKRLSREPSIKDSIRIIDSVRVVEKIKWKTRYKNTAARTTARNEGKHLAPVNPDSMPRNLPKIGTLDRKEVTKEDSTISKMPAIQLTVDGRVVYSSKNDNKSAGGRQ